MPAPITTTEKLSTASGAGGSVQSSERAHGSTASSSSHISSSAAGTSVPTASDMLRGSRSAGPIGMSPAPLSR